MNGNGVVYQTRVVYSFSEKFDKRGDLRVIKRTREFLSVLISFSPISFVEQFWLYLNL